MKVTKDEKNKDKALEQVLADIEKQFGAGAIMKLGDNDHMNVDVTSSGSITIDVALGVGGYPKGRIIVTAILVDTKIEAINKLKKLNYNPKIMEVNISNGRVLDRGVMMISENPIAIISANKR